MKHKQDHTTGLTWQRVRTGGDIQLYLTHYLLPYVLGLKRGRSSFFLQTYFKVVKLRLSAQSAYCVHQLSISETSLWFCKF